MVSSLKRNTASSNLSRYLLWDLKFPAGGHFISSKRTGTSFLSTEIIENTSFEYCTCASWYWTFHWYMQYCIWILILNLTSRSSCIDFKMLTYLSNTFHNAFIHRNIDSKHIFWNFKRTVKIIKISKDSSWRGSIAAETSYALQNNYSVPHINVLDKQVQLYLFNVHLYLSVICILDK